MEANLCFRYSVYGRGSREFAPSHHLVPLPFPLCSFSLPSLWPFISLILQIVRYPFSLLVQNSISLVTMSVQTYRKFWLPSTNTCMCSQTLTSLSNLILLIFHHNDRPPPHFFSDPKLCDAGTSSSVSLSCLFDALSSHANICFKKEFHPLTIFHGYL